MVMKRVEAGEDVFLDRPHPPKMEPEPFVSVSPSTSRSAIVMTTYNTLTQMDQGAVLILYQMAKAM